VTRVANLFDVARDFGPSDRPGYEVPFARIGPLIGGAALGLTVYELALGQSICPYHYEYPGEEWLLVLEGTPSLRDPDGEHPLAQGDVVSFPAGAAGAHKVTNRTDERALVAMLSTKQRPAVAVYPDSDKLGIWAGGPADVELIFPSAAAVDYWHGEA
jgi:uncharacterized cupin superfamily protein